VRRDGVGHEQLCLAGARATLADPERDPAELPVVFPVRQIIPSRSPSIAHQREPARPTAETTSVSNRLIDLDSDVLLLSAFLEGETLHMALAAAELAMGREGFSDPTDALSSFCRRVKETAARHLSVATLGNECRQGRQPSALEVVRSIRALGARMAFCVELFSREETHRDLIQRGDGGRFCSAFLGDSAVRLYLLNRHDPSNPSPAHQVPLLASVSDSLDCIYLQFREHAGHLLERICLFGSDSDDAGAPPSRAIALVNRY
jgi:hypothetical protein